MDEKKDLLKHNLPSGWRNFRLQDLVISQKGKRPRKLEVNSFVNSVPYLDIRAIETGNIDRYADPMTSVLLSTDELVVVWDGSRSGWVGKGKHGALGSTLMALRPINVDIDYLYYFLRSQFEFINGNIKGAGIPHVNHEIFWQIVVPIPPIEEQKRISKKLFDAFEKLTTTRNAVNKIGNIVFSAKQKLLTSAFNGDLSSDWRSINSKPKFDSKVDKSVKNAVGWPIIKAEDCCEKISNGNTPSGKRFEIDNGVPFLKVYNLINQKISFDYKPQFIDELMHKKLSKSISYPGDVLLNIVGPPLGKTAILPATYPEWNMNQALVLFRPKSFLLSEFLYYFFCEGSEIKSIEREYKGSAGQSNISLTQCRNFKLLIPTEAEQKFIVDKIKSQFQNLEIILNKSQSINKNISIATSKILNEAFSGELTSQDPKNEKTISSKDIEEAKTVMSKIIEDNKKIRSKQKMQIMKTKSNLTFLDLLKKEFSQKKFSFDDLEIFIDYDYETLKSELFVLLEEKINMEFDTKTEQILFKIK